MLLQEHCVLRGHRRHGHRRHGHRPHDHHGPLQYSKLPRTRPRKVGCRYLRQPLKVLLLEWENHHDRLPSTCGLLLRKLPQFRTRRGFREWLRHDSNLRGYHRGRLLRPTCDLLPRKFPQFRIQRGFRGWLRHDSNPHHARCDYLASKRNHHLHNHLCCQLCCWCGQSCRDKLRARHHVRHRARHRARHRVRHHVQRGHDVHVRRSSSW